MSLMKKSLLFIFFVSLILYFANLIAIKANLYWTTAWADIVTHTLGGVIVGAIAIFCHGLIRKRKLFWMPLFAITIIVGIIWEVFEVYTGMTSFTDIGYWSDTLGDLVFDTLGAYISYLFLTNSK